jgi:[ribosomal protein S18]-alanine N-acetyltransferase
MAFFSRKLSPSILRRMRVSDAEACAAIHAASFAHPWPASEFESLIASQSVIAVAAIAPKTNAIRGFSLARRAADEAEILTIAVASPLRRHGIGKALLQGQCAHLAAAGVRSLFLEVGEANAAAIDLYSHMGFVRVGARSGYYKGPVQGSGNALILKKTFA